MNVQRVPVDLNPNFSGSDLCPFTNSLVFTLVCLYFFLVSSPIFPPISPSKTFPFIQNHWLVYQFMFPPFSGSQLQLRVQRLTRRLFWERRL